MKSYNQVYFPTVLHKPYIMLFMISAAFFLSQSCDTRKKSIDTSGNITPVVQKTIIVYGSESCDHCNDFRKKLDSVKLKYTFHDVEADERYFNEMMRKIQAVNYKGYIGFPVIDVEGMVYIRPDFRKFMSEINR